MKNQKPFPEHMRAYVEGWRGFKTNKRWDLRDMEKAFRYFRFGSAYLPCDAYFSSCEIEKHLLKLKNLLSRRSWGR